MIGIGSSGIQIVPKLSAVCKSMDVHVRTQTWISPAPGINEPTANDPEMDADYNFTEKSLEIFKDPVVLRDYRAAIMDRRIENFKRAIADSDVQKNAQELFRKSMTERLAVSAFEVAMAGMMFPAICLISHSLFFAMPKMCERRFAADETKSRVSLSSLSKLISCSPACARLLRVSRL